MATAPPGDPRVGSAGAGGVMPVVAPPRAGPSWLFIGIVLAGFAILLFTVLDARRRTLAVSSVRPDASDRSAAATPAAPPPLYVPPAPAPVEPRVEIVPPPSPPPPAPVPAPPQIIYVPQPTPAAPVMPAPPQRVADTPALVFDGTSGQAPSPAASAPAANDADASATASPGIAGTRVRAGVLANRSTTVSQGTLIPAVLETGLDSTRPGLARAMVTRDVRGFDGARILIPRGSRLIGEYRSEASPGQNRALVNWLRLIRPDGVTMAIGSPASDPLGRGGIKASVNNHFFQRFASAILQSTLDVGVNLASRAGNGAVILALPGTVQTTAAPLTQGRDIVPTLKVKPGTSITIFVARDLDFTGAGNRP